MWLIVLVILVTKLACPCTSLLSYTILNIQAEHHLSESTKISRRAGVSVLSNNTKYKILG